MRCMAMIGLDCFSSDKYIINGSKARTICEVNKFAIDAWVLLRQASAHQAKDNFLEIFFLKVSQGRNQQR